MKISRDALLAIGLLIVLTALIVVGALTQPARRQPLSSSVADDGTEVLRVWLESIGYRVSVDLKEEYTVPSNTDMALVIAPSETITTSDWITLDRWVRDGGTLLVAAGRGTPSSAALRHYGFTRSGLLSQQTIVAAGTPLMEGPVYPADSQLVSTTYLKTERDDFVTHFGVERGPVVVSFPQGAGRVILSATDFPFTNEGLRAKGSGELVLNLVGSSGRGSRVWFDEWHHGEQPVAASSGRGGLQDWLRKNPAGRALLYSVACVFIAVALQGQTFGRPVPPVKTIARRAPLEHITAVANLKRRAGHRQAVMEQYRQHLKRELGARYRMSAALGDKAFARQLAVYNPAIDAAALAQLLIELRSPDATEADLVRLAGEVAGWLKQD